MKMSVAFVIPVLAVVLAGVSSCTATAPHANHRLLLRLHDRRSTNAPAWILTVNADGSGTLAHDNIGSINGNKSFKEGTFDIVSLMAALGKLDVGDLPSCSSAEVTAPVEVDVGSVSFGSSATLYYKGRIISSFCLNSPIETAITNQLSKAVATANP